MIQVKLIRENDVLFEASGSAVDGCFKGEYRRGDFWRVELFDTQFVKLQLDETLLESIVYVPDGVFEYHIPFDRELEACHVPGAFTGESHKIKVSEPSAEEIYGERLISLNPHDRHGKEGSFPHAVANFVTREDPCFFERNTIDGVYENAGHGIYPYHSWGGGAREDLEFELHFGREVELEYAVIFIRADFPHDTHWTQGDVEFSDGSRIHVELEKTAEGQRIELFGKRSEFIKLTNLKQQRREDGTLSFAALSQIEVFGKYL